MRYFLTVFTCLIFGQLSAQDTTYQELENVEIQFLSEKEIVFEDSKQFILDFYIGQKGRFILLKRRNNYFLCSLNNDLNINSKLELHFKPQQLFMDCLGCLHVIGRDSMYQVENLNEELFIFEVNPISLYHTFYERCVTSNSSQVIFQQREVFNQSTIFYGIEKKTGDGREIYRIENSLLMRSAKDTYDSLMVNNPGELAVMGEIKGYDLDATRYYDHIQDYKQDLNFFEQIVTSPTNHPIFSRNDTTFIFDYLNQQVVVVDLNGTVIRAHPMSNWQNSTILFDEKRNQFYLAFRQKGGQSYSLLGVKDFHLVKNVFITEHAHPQKAIIYNGFLYYLAKESVDDNLNKLYRQRL